jgi:diaminopropionate ammonia-lyase
MTDTPDYVLNIPDRKNLPLHDELFSLLSGDEALRFHQSIDGYAPTPLYSLPALASRLGIGGLWIKDESKRFGLNAFKSLGASYAIFKLMKEMKGSVTFCTATDGNHGRAVAWSAKRLNLAAVVYVPRGTVPSRIENIEKEGAEVVVVDGDYDTAVTMAKSESKKHGWQLVQDSAWDGYTEIPSQIMAGYTTMFREMEDTIHVPLNPKVDAVFLQAGVGSWAGSAVWYYANRYSDRCPRLVCVEPVAADCVLHSAQEHKLLSIKIKNPTIMAGLNCGTPSLLAWSLLERGVDLFMAIPDRFAEKAMQTLYRPEGSDPRVISGESGAAGLGALMRLIEDPSLDKARDVLGLNSSSRILVYNTEGDTDPVNFKRIVESN